MLVLLSPSTPSFPWRLLPHTKSIPSEEIRAVWWLELDIHLADYPFNPLTTLGINASLYSPKDNSPSWFLPKVQTKAFLLII